jgi:hypothetical protein
MKNMGLEDIDIGGIWVIVDGDGEKGEEEVRG